MKKYPIGFNTRINKEPEINVPMEVCKGVIEPKKSVVQVYFPHRGMGWAYYNDSFDLKVGDFVYVEGKLEGYRGQVTEVNYSFKIKLSDYQKVVAIIDTNVRGDFYLAGSHFVSFDPAVLPYEKIRSWFLPPVKGSMQPMVFNGIPCHRLTILFLRHILRKSYIPWVQNTYLALAK